jgi:autoinducer 2-degrading protein
MIVTFVHSWVKEAHVSEFIEASIENHNHSVKEPGNLRFDILRDAEDPCKFVFYEVFKDEDAVNEHKKTPHYLKWRDTVADWMAQPRKGIRHSVLAPLNEEKW